MKSFAVTGLVPVETRLTTTDGLDHTGISFRVRLRRQRRRRRTRKTGFSAAALVSKRGTTGTSPVARIRFRETSRAFSRSQSGAVKIGSIQRAIRSVCANVVDVKILITAEIQLSAANDRMREVGINGLPFQVELADNVETIRSNRQQGHRALVVQAVDHVVGAGDANLAQSLVEFDSLAGQILDAVETLSTLPAAATEELSIQHDGATVAVVQVLTMPHGRCGTRIRIDFHQRAA